MKHALSLFILAASIGLVPAQAQAEDEKDSSVDVGGAVLIRPAYVGSDQTRTNLLPYLGFENIYGIDMFGLALSAEVIDIGTGMGPGKWSLRAGPRLGFDFGRDSDDSPTLAGLDDIGVSAIVGGYVRSTVSILGFDISGGQDVIGGHEGFVADFSVGTRYPGDGWYIQPIVTLSWADATYTQAIYGVGADAAMRSILPEFNTNNGFHQASATLLGGVELDEDWSLTALVSYREALGDFKDSPIIQAEDGSASGVFATLGISRRFSF